MSDAAPNQSSNEGGARTAPSIVEVLAELVPPEWRAAVENGTASTLQDAAGPDEYAAWYGALAATGVTAAEWPTSAGGLGWTEAAAASLRAELVAIGVVLIGEFEQLRVGTALRGWGSAKQVDRYGPGIIRGTERWCQLFSEPGAGSDLPSLATRAQRDGLEWRVDGQKIWTSGANMADLGLLVARTDPGVPKRKGLTIFVVDMRSAGVEIRPIKQMTGDAEFCEVFLDSVRLADSARIGEVNQGWPIARAVLAGERQGISGGRFDRSTVDAATSLRELIRRRLASGGVLTAAERDAAVQAYISGRILEWLTVRLFASGRGAQTASLGKLAGADHNQRFQSARMILTGLPAIATGPDDTAAGEAGRLFLRSVANSIEGGTSEIHRSTVAEQVLGLPREPDPFLDAPWATVPRSHGSVLPPSPSDK
jgi:alkylation response protein AidB-like acyl-CoA dehydrogenase